LKNIQSLQLTLLFILTTIGASAQIVTSKKEAQQKGIYAYQDKTVAMQQMPSRPSAPGVQQPAAIEPTTLAVLDAVTADVTSAKKEKGGPKKLEETKKKSKKKLSVNNEPTPADFTPDPSENYFAQQIVNNAMEFEGVHYRGGGTTPAGMDCSGMVYATFQIFDITLPRSSAAMAQGAGVEIKLEEVKKGDLLFFDNNPGKRRINHVGLVTEVTPEGEIKFIHSTLSSGVMVSSMNENYYIKTYVQANRVIEEAN
jgi:lipoprotein Spr